MVTFSNNKDKWDSISKSVAKVIAEQRQKLDEISKEKAAAYKEKAGASLKKAVKYDNDVSNRRTIGPKTVKKFWKNNRNIDNRTAGIKRADKVLSKESEQLDELSKKTMASYAEKGTKDAVKRGERMDTKTSEKGDRKKFMNRLAGVAKVRSRLK